MATFPKANQSFAQTFNPDLGRAPSPRLGIVTCMDPGTQKWVYQALRGITGQNLAHDPAAWRNTHFCAKAAG